MRLSLNTATLALSLVLGTVPALSASELAAASGDVILTVSGKIGVTNADGVAQFDLALLESLPQHSFKTSTIWTEGENTYSGVLLKDLLAAVGAEGGTINATALNDYKISFPVADVAGDAPLVAYHVDGAPMSVRDKGPLWLIFPFDTNAAYRTEETYARSIWQMDRLEVTD